MRAAKAAQKDAGPAEAEGEDGDDVGEGDFGSRMRSQMQAKRKAMGVEQPAAAAEQEGNQPELDYGESDGEAAEEEQAEAEGAALLHRCGICGLGRCGRSVQLLCAAACLFWNLTASGGARLAGLRAAPRKRSRLAEQGRGKKSAAAVVAPSKQIKVADSELLTDWERKRQVRRCCRSGGGPREWLLPAPAHVSCVPHTWLEGNQK